MLSVPCPISLPRPALPDDLSARAVAELREGLRSLSTRLEEGETSSLGFEIHRLVGTAAVIDRTDLVERLREAESAASSRDVDRLRASLISTERILASEESANSPDQCR